MTNVPPDENQVSNSKKHIKIMKILAIFSTLISLQTSIFPNSLKYLLDLTKVHHKRVCSFESKYVILWVSAPA